MLDPEPDITLRTSPAMGYPSNLGVVAGVRVLFLRRWRIDVVDASLGLREITVVVVPNGTSTQPLAIKRTQVDLAVR